MKNQQRYDFFPEKPRYIETRDEAKLPHHFYSKAYEAVIMNEEYDEEYDEERTFWERCAVHYSTLRERARRGQWGKIGILCSLLLMFSMLYSGDKKDKIDSSLLMPAHAQEEAKETSEMSDEELEKLRFEEELAKKKANKAKEDAEIVKSLQLLKEMKEREESLLKREEELKVKENRMRTIEEGVNNRIAEMEKLKKDLEGLVKMREDLGEESIKKLVKAYENMKPNEAANVLERVDEDIAVQVLLRMKGKKAGKILNVMKPGKSVRLSEEIARRK